MPSPKNARLTSAKKSPEAKVPDLGQTLAKKKSQDFKSKIAGWNQSGGGVAGEAGGVAAVEKPGEDVSEDVKVVERTPGGKKDKSGVKKEEDPAEAEAPPKTPAPATPKTPGSGEKAAEKPVSARKAPREIDPARKAWVRRRSRPQVDGSPDVQPDEVPKESPGTKPKVATPAKPKATPNSKVKASPDADKKVSPKAKASNTPKVDPETSEEKKQAVTPKRRVVSDTHWRKERGQKEESQTPEKAPEKENQTTPKPRIVRRSVVSLGLKVPPSVQSFSEEPPRQPARVRPLRRRSPSRSASDDGDDAREATPDFESSGMKIYIKSRRKPSAPEQPAKERRAFNTSESSFTVPSSVEKAGSLTDVTTPDATPITERTPRISVGPNVKPRRRSPENTPVKDKTSSDAEDEPRYSSRRRPRISRGDEDSRTVYTRASDARASMNESFRIPANKSPPTPIPKVFGNRIEGWLAGMPDDPFVESTGSSFSDEVPGRSRDLSERAEELHTEDKIRAEDSNSRTKRSRTEQHLRSTPERPQPAVKIPATVDEWINKSDQILNSTGARQNANDATKTHPTGAANSKDKRDMPPADFSRRSSKRRTYGDLHKHQFPSTGHRLSTIASVSTLRSLEQPRGSFEASNSSARHASLPGDSVLSRASDGDEPTRNTTVVRRRVAKHSDLMSVLSISRDDGHDLTSHRSTRTRRPRHSATSATVGDLMNEISSEELKYQRELRTLVDGVVPVLLQYVVSSQHRGKQPHYRAGDPALTQPIVEMGVALERLKATHRRIPMHNPNELLLWAQSSAKVYADYLRVWRLGFNDIVVNLAPADKSQDDESTWDDGLERNSNGDLLDGDGERVDVADLLKRPLVRIKTLGKVFKGISETQPSALAEEIVNSYQELLAQAKQRSNDERARLEDEAAAAIDPSRARDLKNLVPLGGVSIDPTRRVRARDFFDLELFHSSGQQLGCRIEMVLRDDAPDRGTSGDILFCEVSAAGRWLLFPPILMSNVSARIGDKDDEIVIMVRGGLADGGEWRELLSLQSSETQGGEWTEMLGSDPMPPRLNRQSSFNDLRGRFPPRDRRVSFAESEVPIGEQALPTAPQWDGSDVNSVPSTVSWRGDRTARPVVKQAVVSNPVIEDDSRSPRPPRHGSGNGRLDHRFASAKDRGIADNTRRPWTDHRRSRTEQIPNDRPLRGHDDSSARQVSSDRNDRDGPYTTDEEVPSRRPTLRKRTSSVPSMELPTIHKLRKALGVETPRKEPDARRVESTPVGPTKEPASAPSKLQKPPPPPTHKEIRQERDTRPSDTTNAPKTTGLGSIPSFTPAFLKRHQRASSPLKHEYEPSTASESSSESDFSDVEDVESITSESSAGEPVSTIGELKDFSKGYTPRPLPPRPPPSTFSLAGDTLGPSDSASQAPYRTVPRSNEPCAKSVACLSSWSERNAWESMHPEECEIVVTAGLIEAFDLAQAHAVTPKVPGNEGPSPSTQGVKPLVAFELTPWVPIRRGTALDISIRSAPTPNSVLRNGNYIQFRSRSPQECERLYNLINRARIDNPTWIALQNARGPTQTSNWGEAMDRRNAERSDPNTSSWLKSLTRKNTTYRSKGTRSASIAPSQSSVGTLNSAFSAIRQFSGTNRIFNIAKSTIMSKQSTRSSGSDSLSSGAATPLPIDPSMGTPAGISNAKIRLYVRETTTKWVGLGNARLTIMLPPRPDPSIPADPRTTGLEKRILVHDKKGNTLLDVTLGEHCFERVARTGIAVSVWEEGVGSNGEIGHAAATGGVVSSKSMVYMIQMKSERDAAFTFSMVGKLRY